MGVEMGGGRGTSWCGGCSRRRTRRLGSPQAAVAVPAHEIHLVADEEEVARPWGQRCPLACSRLRLSPRESPAHMPSSSGSLLRPMVRRSLVGTVVLKLHQSVPCLCWSRASGHGGATKRERWSWEV